MLTPFRKVPDAGGQPERRPGCIRNFGLASTSLAAVLLAGPALAAPAAGTVIGNQATVTYEDASGQSYSVNSNLVETTINQVVAVDIEADQSKQAVPGGLIDFPHTITNTGNGSDIFDIIADMSGAANLTLVDIYPDENLDGEADTLTPIAATPTLAAGESYGIIVRAEVSAGATPGVPESFTVAAESTTEAGIGNVSLGGTDADGDNFADDSNTDTVNFTTGPIIELTKSMVLAPGGDIDGSGTITPGDVLRIRVTYKNTGAADATDVAITDDLTDGSTSDPTQELTYEASSGVWSDGGTMDDAAGGGPDHTNGSGDTIDYDAATTDVVVATISTVPAGREGYVEFDATIEATASDNVYNEADASYSDGVGTLTAQSNEAFVTILTSSVVGVTLGDSNTGDGLDDGSDLPDGNLGTGNPGPQGDVASGTDTGTAFDDVVQETGTYAAGEAIDFEFVIENHSTVTEAFDLTVANVDFPAGTTFSFVASNGVALLDGNGDGNPDVQLADGATGTFTLRVTMPAGDHTASPVSAVVRATSQVNTAEFNESTAEFAGEVVGASVDLENSDSSQTDTDVADDGGTPGAADDATGGFTDGAYTELTVEPGTSGTFYLRVENNGAASDSYNLAWATATASDDLANPGSGLPSGWSVVFQDLSGNTITNTGVIAAGGFATVQAVVTVSPSATPADSTGIWFRAASATTNGVYDIKLDRVVVGDVVDLRIATDRTAQASPGGTVTMTHTLSNVGNVVVTEGAISYAPPFDTFTETLYVDTNSNGVLDVGTDAVVANITDFGPLNPGDSVTLFSRVQVPSTGVAGLTETATVTVATSLNNGTDTDTNPDNNDVTETVTVVSGDVDVVKEQARDDDCDGTPETPFGLAQLQANPGQCIQYRVTAENTGTADALNVIIDDVVPNFTSLNTAFGPDANGGTGPATTTGAGTDGDTGPIGSTHGTLAPGEQATLEFMVEIDS